MAYRLNNYYNDLDALPSTGFHFSRVDVFVVFVDDFGGEIALSCGEKDSCQNKVRLKHVQGMVQR